MVALCHPPLECVCHCGKNVERATLSDVPGVRRVIATLLVLIVVGVQKLPGAKSAGVASVAAGEPADISLLARLRLGAQIISHGITEDGTLDGAFTMRGRWKPHQY